MRRFYSKFNVNRLGITDRVQPYMGEVEQESRQSIDAERLSNYTELQQYGITHAVLNTHGYLQLDNQWNITSANHIFLEMFGYTLDELVGQPMDMLNAGRAIHDDARLNVRANIAKGKAYSGQIRRYTKQGEAVWVQVSCYPLYDAQAQVHGASMFVTDVTLEREESAHYESQINELVSVMATAEFDLQGNILAVNDIFVSLMGYDNVSDLVGQNHRILVPPDDIQSQAYSDFWQKLAQGEALAGQRTRISKHGEPRHIQAFYGPLYNAQGNVFGVFKIASDITATVEEQVHVSRLARELTMTYFGVESVVEELSSSSKQAFEQADTAIQCGVQMMLVNQLVSDVGESMNKCLKELRVNADRTSKVSNETLEVAKKSSKVVDDLRTHNKKIESAIMNITQIAKQTNLLALNATIEAARAGDEGRGFAVVASEVKELSRSAMAASEEIVRCVDGIGKASTRVEKFASAIESRNVTLNDEMNSILDSVGSLSEKIDESTVHIAESNKRRESLLDNLIGLTKEADNNAKLSDKIRNFGEQLGQAAKELVDILHTNDSETEQSEGQSAAIELF